MSAGNPSVAAGGFFLPINPDALSQRYLRRVSGVMLKLHEIAPIGNVYPVNREVGFSAVTGDSDIVKLHCLFSFPVPTPLLKCGIMGVEVICVPMLTPNDLVSKPLQELRDSLENMTDEERAQIEERLKSQKLDKESYAYKKYIEPVQMEREAARKSANKKRRRQVAKTAVKLAYDITLWLFAAFALIFAILQYINN